MSAAASVVRPVATRELLSAATRRLDWKVLAATVAIAGAIYIWLLTEGRLTALDTKANGWELSRAILSLMVALGTMFATLVADEAVDRGARARADVLRLLGSGEYQGVTGRIRFAADHTRADPALVYEVVGDQIRAVP